MACSAGACRRMLCSQALPRPMLRSRGLGDAVRWYAKGQATSRPRPNPPQPPPRTTARRPKPQQPPSSSSTQYAQSQSYAPPPPPQQTLKSIWEQRKYPLSGMLALALAFGYYFSKALAPSPPPCCSDHPDYPTGRPTPASGQTAAEFDESLDRTESKQGITALRERIASLARGNVLEIAIGTGRNVEFYSWDNVGGDSSDSEEQQGDKKSEGGREGEGMTSFTGIDVSSEMMDLAMKRLQGAIPSLKEEKPSISILHSTNGTGLGGNVEYLDGRLRLIKADVQDFAPPPPPRCPPTTKYDTIIQTFGLCSVSSPKEVLSTIASCLAQSGGRAILLEHGRGTWWLMNKLLDRHAQGHFARYGCWWNRDIEGIVRAEAEGVGLEVVRVERPGWFQFGTLVWIELKLREGSG